MKSKHTPGPWRVNGKQSIRGPRGEYIAGANWNNGEANARLIAAAPDLLALAQKIVHGNWTPVDWVQEARAAIAKATGE